MNSKNQTATQLHTLLSQNPQNTTTNLFKRTARFRQRSSPSRSDSSLTNFFIKQVTGSFQDPKMINKMLQKNSNLNLSHDDRILTPNIQKKNKIKPQTDKYEFLSKKQSKMIEQLSDQIKKQKNNYHKLQQKYKLLQHEKNLADEKIGKLSQQIERQNYHCNPINRLKNHKFLEKVKTQSNLNALQLQKYQYIEKELFQAKKTIKHITLELDCVKIRAFKELEKEKEKKQGQYSQLKGKYNLLLKQYAQVLKKNKSSKKQIISINKKANENSHQDIWSLSSGD